MQYKPSTEGVSMMGGNYIFLPKPLSLADEPEVKRTRKILLIILSVCFTIHTMSMSIVVSKLKSDHYIAAAGVMPSLVVDLIAVLFYGFGILVAYRYYQRGLRVVAWLGIIILVLHSITIVLRFAGIIRVSTVTQDAGNNVHEQVTFRAFRGWILFLTDIVIYIPEVIIVKFAFKLARLIDANKYVTAQPV